MRTQALQTDAPRQAPRLRLVARREPAAWRSHRHAGPSRHASAPEAPRGAPSGAKASAGSPQSGGERLVLVAGGERNSRAAVMRDLTATMPPNTRFDEANDAWEVLALAPESRMIVLSGDLGDLSASSAMHMLAHRLPELPVVSLAACA